MGKHKTYWRIRATCALQDLHLSPDEHEHRILKHYSKIPTVELEHLLAHVGRLRVERGKTFTGRICSQCIDRFSTTGFITMAQASFKDTRSPSVALEMEEDSLGDQTFEESLIYPHITTSEAVTDTEPVIVLSIANIRNDIRSIPADLRALFAYELAAAERENIRQDTAVVAQVDKRDLPQLIELCGKDYLHSRNLTLVNFLLGLYNGSTQRKGENNESNAHNLPQKQSHVYRLSKAAEVCMALSRPTSILPYHFRESVLLSSSTKSRKALAVISSTAPHGSYQTVKAWSKKLATVPPEPPQTGDILGMFDNNQVMQRRWNISVDKTSTCSVITMVAYIEIEPQGSLQFREDLKPGNWMWDTLTPESIEHLKKGHQNVEHHQSRFWKHLYPWLLKLLQEVVVEQTREGDTFKDEVDDKVFNEKYKQCTKCGNTQVPKKDRKCPLCEEKLPVNKKQSPACPTTKQTPKSTTPSEMEVSLDHTIDGKCKASYHKVTPTPTEYDHLPSQHQETPPKVTIGQPVFENPCSYVAVAKVFREIGKKAGLKRYGGKREWLPIVCDGLPFIIGYQLIERTFICSECGDTVEGMDGRLSHSKTHNGCNGYEQEFDWLLLQPGPGHVEMNMLRAFVKFTWPVFWERMAELFNFKSEQAKRAAFSVSDHHKGWAMARIAREAYAKEMIVPYVRQQRQRNEEVSVPGFLTFAMSKDRSPNYIMMSDMIFEVLGAIFTYRMGVRTGHIDLMEAGKSFFSRMWCARPHPMYRQLSAYDSIMSVCMPECMKEFMAKTKSINLSGLPYTGEGADFKLEALNRMVQQTLTGNPKETDWEAACVNQPKLATLHQHTVTEMDLKDPNKQSSKRKTVISNNVLALRSSIRQSDFLADKDKDGNRPALTSCDGNPLEPGLEKFAAAASDMEVKYLNAFLKHKISGGFMKRGAIQFKEDPVFVTEDERKKYTDINKRTILECTALIKAKITEIEDEEMQQDFTDVFQSGLFKSGKALVKQDYIDFYLFLCDYVTSATSDNGNCNEDSDDED